MADPLTCIIAAGAGIDTAIKATKAISTILSECHDLNTERHLTRLNRVFLKAKHGTLTEADLTKAWESFARVQAAAFLSRNAELLEHLETVLVGLEKELLLRKTERVEKVEGSRHDGKVENVERALFGEKEANSAVEEDVAVDAMKVAEVVLEVETDNVVEDAVLKTFEDAGGSTRSEKWRVRLGKSYEMLEREYRLFEKPAARVCAACLPPLLLVPKFRQQC